MEGYMTNTKDIKKGEEILKILESGITPDGKRTAENPLYTYYPPASNKRSNYYTYNPIIQKTFEFMAAQGYSLYLKDDDLKNAFRAAIRPAPSYQTYPATPAEQREAPAAWASKLDKQNLAHLVYYINYLNNKNLADTHQIAESVCNGLFHAMVKRVIELGPYQEAAPAASTPAPSL